MFRYTVKALLGITLFFSFSAYGVKFKTSPMNFQAAVGKSFSVDMQSLITDVGTGTLKWSFGSKPAWLTIDTAASTMSGTPGVADIGQKTFTLSVQQGDSGAIGVVVIKVLSVPLWTENPVNLGKQNEGASFQFDLKTKVSDPAGQALTFSVVSGLPSWLSLSSSGVLTGTPQRANVGKYSDFIVLASNASGGSAQVSLFGEVLKVVKPPKWTVPQFDLADAFEDSAYSKDVSSFVTNPEGTPLTFSLVKGTTSGWLKLSSQGTYSGTPGAQDVGTATVTAKLSTVIDGLTYVDTADFRIKVIHVNHLPSWTQNPISVSIDEEKAYSLNLAPLVKDVDTGDTLSFTKVSGPAWLTLSGSTLSGTPQMADEGLNTFDLLANDGKGGTASAKLLITVLHVNHAPYWTVTSVALPNTPERTLFSTDLSTFARDKDPNDTKTFTKISGPSWAVLNPTTGVLSGTPQRADVGANSFQVRVTDAAGAFAEVLVNFTVDKVNRAPKWVANPLILADSFEDTAVSVNFLPSVTDDDGDALSFKQLSGPSWLQTNSQGILAGMPRAAQVGDFSLQVEVSDGEAATTNTIKGRVIHVNHLPVVSSPIKLTILEREVRNESLTKFVSDVDGDTLSFTLKGTYSWLSLDAQGMLRLAPLFSQIGKQTLEFEVSDGSAKVGGQIEVTVLRDPRPPVWSQNPITFQIPINKAFTTDLSSKVTDRDGLALVFSKKSGPAWLTLSAQGLLTGTPTKAEIGDNTLVVTATNDLLGADVTVIVSVFDPNRAPQWTQNPVVLPNGPEKVAYTGSLASYATDPDSDPLTFTKVSGPTWLTVSASGQVSGTPARAQVGLNSFVVRITDPGEKFAETTVQITVDYVNQSPVWSANPITLPNAKERSAYSQALSSFASDPDQGDTLTFAKVSGPTWATVSSLGVISGTPARSDLGKNTFVLSATDQKGLSAQVTVFVTVDYVNNPPQWTQNPVALTDAFEDKAYQFSVAFLATDADKDALTFKKVQGPAWVSVSASGILSGTPGKADLGNLTLVLEVSDGKESAQVNAVGKVIHTNHLPVIASDLSFTVKERDVVTKDLAQSVSDSDGEALTYQGQNLPTWMTLDSQGKLTLSPKYSQIGNYVLSFEVSDGIGKSVGTFAVTVVRNPRPPVWSENPILFTANINRAFTQDLSSKVSDLDGIALTFTKKSGPAWLTLSAQGVISGTPTESQLGANSFVVSAANDLLGADVTVVVQVVDPNRAPVWKQNPIQLTDAYEDGSYQFDLSTWAQDPDNDALTFKKVQGPAWLSLSSAGKLSGIPGKTDVGPVSMIAEVSDGKLSSQVQLIGQVIHTNHPPVINPNLFVYELKERSTLTTDLKRGVTDSDGDKLAFTLVGTSAFAKVSADGTMIASPTFSDIGKHTYALDIFDGTATVRAELIITVSRDPRPPVWSENPVLFTTNAEGVFQADISAKAQDLDGIALSFKKESGPSWLSVSAEGKLGGIPHLTDLGVNTFSVSVSNDKLSASTVLQITVLDPNHAPYWTQNPVRLPNAKEDQAYQETVAPFAKDDDAGDVLTFQKIAGAKFLTVAPNGVVTGTPDQKDLGLAQLTVRVSDKRGTSADVAVEVMVDHVNHAPVWTQNPLQLPDVFDDAAFKYESAPFATDKDGDALTFRLVSGPAWLSSNASGTLSGNPARSDVGNYQAVVEASDGKATSLVSAVGKVVHRNHPPVITDPQNLRFVVKERETLSRDLKNLVTDSDGDSLTFSLSETKPWISLTPAGGLTLTPKHSDLGTYSLNLTVDDGEAKISSVMVIEVIRDAQAPVWAENPIEVTTYAKEAFSFDLKSRVTELDGMPLSFSKNPGPGWLTVSASGLASGTPSLSAVGDNTFTIVAKNDARQSEVTFLIHVVKRNHAPYWTQIPLNLGSWPAEAEMNFNAAGFAFDEDFDTLKFEVVSGPSWLLLSSDGKVTGIPVEKEIGNFTAVFRVSDGQLSAEVPVIGSVTRPGNRPPTVVADALRFRVKERSTLVVNLNDPKYVSDPDGDDLAFNIRPPLLWSTITAAGKLTLNPLHENLGDHLFTLRIVDTKGAALETPLYVTVEPDPQPPVWLQNPITLEAKVNQNFLANLSSYAQSPTGSALSFSLISGSTWLAVGSNGSLAGVPKAVGEERFEVSARNEYGSTSATLVIVVKPAQDQVDVVQVDKAVPGARAENVWVIDNTCTSCGSDPLAYQIKKSIGVYYQKLNQAQINHQSVLLASDAYRYDGKPIKSKAGATLLDSANTAWVTDFNNRVSSTYVDRAYNTPIWTLFRFYQRLPGISDIYHRSFYKEEVPMDVMVASSHIDYFTKFSKNTPQSKWTVNDFTTEFLKFNAQEKKSYRVSTIAPQCPTSRDSRANSYEQLAQGTGGIAYQVKCDYLVDSFLKDYADRVIFRAYVHAKNHMKLSQKPLLGSLALWLGGQNLAGNTGSQSDLWYYDAAKNEIVIQWHLIDLSTVKPGDLLEARYRY